MVSVIAIVNKLMKKNCTKKLKTASPNLPL